MRHGMTLLELLLVVGIMAIFAASSAPFVVRSMSWVYEVASSEHEFSVLYDASMVLSRYIAQRGVSNIEFQNGALKIGSNVVIDRVTKWNVTPIADDNALKCEITIEDSLVGEQFLRFVVFKPQ